MSSIPDIAQQPLSTTLDWFYCLLQPYRKFGLKPRRFTTALSYNDLSN
ncbi:MAG: hypothetical protein GPJ01_19785 [Microcystis aeruginosa LL13-06]|nr:hypothetical protein [Microcystis aeruginosa LL13-06]